ncbi:hypothetical protein [Virgibacillus necropolis]|uniref:Uncharacterized protein n=1 Tax=Virgibacillus necropolis TaxID=163877 RepID=A0A221MAJ1_9BACI|nr:hypothetical protein [Virgibacillus necropolis]ASN04676.1 hypothetical protein CFK40_06435 [Virgibacillus necropolis]
MGKRKKNKAKTPRHRRQNCHGRLQAAPHWIPTFNGKNLVKGYSAHFGVDKMCAVNELEILGYSFNDEYKRKLKDALIQKQKQTKKQKAAEMRKNNEFVDEESNETFAFIAGYTSGGAHFGLTWEEWEQDEGNSNSKKDAVSNIDDENLPF